MSPSSICAWLEDALNFHLRYCPNCLGRILGRDGIRPLVTFTLSCGFVVAVSGEQAAWSLAGIASLSFTVGRALKRLLPGPAARVQDLDVSHDCLTMFLQSIPGWLLEPEPVYHLRLESLTKAELISCSRQLLDGNLRVPRTKQDALNLILSRYLRERTACFPQSPLSAAFGHNSLH
ncbi:hypothetical protein NP233_g2540 [Leucocoprinus birnbaumii]|uniref:Uncharacterized protein n=1 Tax=Leucocoprinus birnbaumii TaxID=56174 RepID=A0AAD5VY42_9AGAR|nr:hypothetical protein NP233_g2540 [Leucocoprinus birnbaumii]